ncbi:hypothetical protein BS78_K147400 [Paspalum vaginatum]|uniref:Uncharacterized protein n=1 Tax=Paspalum vaginatum TaxID=158149 RepID=A0A9W8CCT5_9POAL|nr:hypothetical protein BS78_K147400 [Paspalum vaginatum]
MSTCDDAQPPPELSGDFCGSELADEMKRHIMSLDCKASGRNFMEFPDRITEDSDKEEELGPLHDAARKAKMDTCQGLVEKLGFDVNIPTNDGSGKTPLSCSVSCGKVIAVRYLLDKGADLNKQDVTGFAPLHYAAKQGYDEIAQHHADPSRVSPNHCTPLAEVLSAADEKVNESDRLKCMNLLVKAGADLNSMDPVSPLVIATRKGLTGCVDYLLEVGADANIGSKDGGRTPIEIAAKSGRRGLVESLLPFTSPIRTVSDWSVEGIIAYARSMTPPPP